MERWNYDVGLGRDYFYLYVKGKKKPVAKILASETHSTKDVEKWAKREYSLYSNNKKDAMNEAIATLLNSGYKYPTVAKILASETDNPEDVEKWAKREYNKLKKDVM